MQRPRKPGPARARRPTDNPRLIALNALQDVTRSDAYASLALGKRLRDARLDARDRALATELVYGTLEKQIALDFALDLKLERKDLDSVARDILRVGAYQILYLDRVPDSAAVDESVKLARLVGKDAFTGLVNAVLRALARDRDGIPWPKRDDDPALYLSVVHSVPKWIVERLIAAYGVADTEAIAAYRPDERTITVRRTRDKLSAADFEAMMRRKGWAFTPSPLPDAYRVSGTFDVGLDKEFLQGLYSVQGEASVLAALAVAPARAATVLDACAAPGGKTALLSELMGGTGRVHAWDVHEHRVELIRGMVKRLRLDNVRPAVRDATVVKDDWEGTIDAVLIDAPCSGLGVMLHKPDVKYRQTPEGIESLVKMQAALLDACAGYVKPGGTLVYSTCTLLPEENAGQATDFLAKHAEFSLDDDGLRAALPEHFRDRVDGGTLQLLPHRDHTDGFFIVRMRKAPR